jgi:hypothetical protein
MLKQLLLNLFLTTIISMFIAMVYLMINEHFMLMDFDMSFYTVATMVLFLQVVTLITALPALLLCIPSVYKSRLKRLVAYFLLISILFSTSIFLCITNQDFLETFVLLSFPITIFIIVHAIFYSRLIKKRATTNNAV